MVERGAFEKLCLACGTGGSNPSPSVPLVLQEKLSRETTYVWISARRGIFCLYANTFLSAKYYIKQLSDYRR